MTNANDSAGSHCVWVGDIHQGHSIGLTKREYFAAMAMQALVANPANYEFFQKTKINPGEVREQTAITAIQFADALIAELNK